MIRLSISKKTILPMMLIVTSLVASIAICSAQIKENNQANLLLNSHIQPAMDKLEDAYRDMYQVLVAASNMSQSDDKSYKEMNIKEFNSNAYKVVPRLTKTAELLNMFEQIDKQELVSLTHMAERWIKKFEPMFINPEKNADFYINNHSSLEKDFTKIRKKLKTVRRKITEIKKTLKKNTDESIKNVEMTISLSVFFSILVSIISILITNRFVIKPIKHIESAMADIAQGDGDLTKRITIVNKDELGDLAGSFNAFVQKINLTIKEVVTSSHTVRQEVQNVMSLTNNMTTFSSNQQQESELLATAVHEMQTNISAVNSNAQEAAVASDNATIEVEQSNKILDTTVSSIETLSTDLDSASNVIQDLYVNVDNIVSVLDVIKGIAEQTNLLALNAAIEAARAGEQGRGFAVVADEVRSLAGRTQESTYEIQGMTECLLEGAKNAVDVMDKSRASRQETIQFASSTTVSLNAIQGSIEGMNQMNTHIAAASEEQSTVSQEVSLNIQSIADNSRQMQQMIANADSACVSLSEQCSNLERLVSEFKI